MTGVRAACCLMFCVARFTCAQERAPNGQICGELLSFAGLGDMSRLFDSSSSDVLFNVGPGSCSRELEFRVRVSATAEKRAMRKSPSIQPGEGTMAALDTVTVADKDMSLCG